MKTEKIDVRISVEEKTQLQEKADKSGLSLSEYVRRSALQKKISFRLTPEEIKIYKDLRTYNKNFASISNLFSKSDPQLNQEVRNFILVIQDHLMKLQS